MTKKEVLEIIRTKRVNALAFMTWKDVLKNNFTYKAFLDLCKTYTLSLILLTEEEFNLLNKYLF